MKKNVKVALILLAVGAILLWVLLMAINMTEATLPSETVFPEGTLSESIFESQNNIYTENGDLPNIYSFYEVPYKVSVPNAKGATVGSGRMYDYDDNFLIYVGEYDEVTDSNGLATLSAQLGKAILIDADEDACVMQNMTSDAGYINGFAANYMSNIFYVSNGEGKEKEVCLTAYNLNVENQDYNITLAVVSKVQSTQHLAVSKQILDIMAGTCIYSEELAAMQEAEEEMQKQEEEMALLEEEKESVVPEEGQSNLPTEDLLVSIEESYTDLVLYFNFSKEDSLVSARLYTPDKMNFYNAASNNNGVMIFHVGAAQPGDYILEVTGDYGTGNVQLTDNVSPVYDAQTNVEDENESEDEPENSESSDDSQTQDDDNAEDTTTDVPDVSTTDADTENDATNTETETSQDAGASSSASIYTDIDE